MQFAEKAENKWAHNLRDIILRHTFLRLTLNMNILHPVVIIHTILATSWSFFLKVRGLQQLSCYLQLERRVEAIKDIDLFIKTKQCNLIMKVLVSHYKRILKLPGIIHLLFQSCIKNEFLQKKKITLGVGCAM